jgi:hypothetical protein
MKIRHIIITLVYFTIIVIRFDEETKIMQVPLDFTSYPYSKYVSFVVANPPKDTCGLLSLLSSHLQSFASNDTIKKYHGYYHYYYEETLFTPLDSRREQKYYYSRGRPFYEGTYSDDHEEDLLMNIRIETEHNIKDIRFCRKRRIEIEINLPWKTDRQPPYGSPTIIFYKKEMGHKEKEITFYVDGTRENLDKEYIICRDWIRKREIIYKDRRPEKEIIYKNGKREKEIIYKNGRRKKDIIYKDGKREKEIIYKDVRLLSPEEV